MQVSRYVMTFMTVIGCLLIHLLTTLAARPQGSHTFDRPSCDREIRYCSPNAPRAIPLLCGFARSYMSKVGKTGLIFSTKARSSWSVTVQTLGFPCACHAVQALKLQSIVLRGRPLHQLAIFSKAAPMTGADPLFAIFFEPNLTPQMRASGQNALHPILALPKPSPRVSNLLPLVALK